MHPPHPDDAALSAYLDGEATPEEAAGVETCSTCAARTDVLRRAAKVIGSPVTAVDDGRRDAAIAAALAVRVVPLEHRRRTPPPWVLGAAAAVLVVALGLVSLANGDQAADDGPTAAGRAGDTALQAPAADEESATMLQAGPVDAGDLGALADTDIEGRVTSALTGAGAAGGGTGGDGAETDPAGPGTCEPALRETADLGALRLTARATVDGRASWLLAFDAVEAGAPVLRVYVVAEGRCDAVLHERSLPPP